MASDEPTKNVYENLVEGVIPNPAMPSPGVHDLAFLEAANDLILQGVELLRLVVPCHQSAIALIVDGDWSTATKAFSLSEKYSAWSGYKEPAKGFGVHAWLLQHNRPVRMTQTELEAHPEWMEFGTEAFKHPPMRGWMAAPITDVQNRNWGLVQVSDKIKGDFTKLDETDFLSFVAFLNTALGALWDLRCERVARERDKN